MENRKFVGRSRYWVFGILVIIILPNRVLAYGLSTHRNLTAATIELYNRNFPDNKISKELAGSLLEGSVREDDPPRWLNHFYDPLYNRGLTTLNLSFIKAKEWATDRDNFQSWQRGLALWQKEEKEKAGLALGHVLHLLQDQAVPDHTRNDLHPGDSPYENFVRGRKPKNFEKKEPVLLDGLEQYFEELANYSHKNFYSKDSIDLVEYPLPKPDFFAKKTDYDYGMKQDEEFGDYFLVKEEKDKEEDNYLLVRKAGSLLFKDLALSIDDPKILNDYWERLSIRAIQYGAGMLQLFFKEAAAGPVTVEGPEPEELLARTLGMANLLSVFQGGGERGLELKEVVGLEEKETDLEDLDELGDLDLDIGDENGDGARDVESAARPKTTPAKSKDCKFPAVSPAGGAPAVVINEIAWMGSKKDSNHEWLELKNITSSQDLNIGGWWLLSADGQIKINFPSGAALPPGGYYLLERTDDEAMPQVRADHIFKGALANKGEYLRLADADCRLIDEINAASGWLAGDVEEKRTMERKEGGGWQSFLWSDLPHILGTPKMANSFGQPAIIPGSAVGGGSSTGSILPPPPPSPSPPPPVTPPPAPSPPAGGETTGQTPAKVVKINEFLFDAAGGDEDREFIELYNTSDQEIDISGWSIQTGSAGSPQAQKKNFEAGDKIQPQSFFLIWLGAHPMADMEWASGSLKNSSSSVYLVRKQQKIADAADPEIEDRVNYDVNNLAGFAPGASWERDPSTGSGRVQPNPNPQSSQGPASIYFYSNLAHEPVLELRWSGVYPWMPAYYVPQSAAWDLLVFYLNPDPLGMGRLTPASLSTADGWAPPVETGVVRVKYPNYTGSDGLGYYSLLLPRTADRSGNGGGAENRALNPSWIEDKNLIIKVADPTAVTGNDYVQVAYYDFSHSGGGEQRFRLLALDGRRYFFGQPPTNNPPQINGELNLNFNSAASRLEINWPAAADGDDLDRDLKYQISFICPAAAMMFCGDGDWREFSGYEHQTQVNLGEPLTVKVRAADKVNFSRELSGSLQPAVDFFYVQAGAGGWGNYFGYKNDNYPGEPPPVASQVLNFPAAGSFNRLAVRLEQSAPLGADAARLRIRVLENETELGMSEVGRLVNPDPNLDIIFSFSQPVNLAAGQDYQFQLEAVEYSDWRGFLRNSWRNALSGNGQWYLKLGLE